MNKFINKKNIKFIILSALILYIFIFSDIGIISKIKLDNKIKSYKNNITQIKEQNDCLKLKIEKLNKDKDYIAEIARKLGYAHPGEKIYRFTTPEKEKTNQSPQSNQMLQPKLTVSTGFHIKDYLIYIITFFIVVIIYIILLRSTK